MDPEKALTSFVFELEARGRSPRTVEKYRYAWKKFQEYRPIEDLTALDERTLLDWYTSMRQRGWKPATLNTFGKDLNTFLNYCRKRGWISFTPPNPPTAPKQDRSTFNKEQLQRMLDAAARGRNHLRNRALVLLLLGTGLRLGEVSGLELRDLDFNGGLVHVRPERAKDRERRIVPMGHACRQALYEYISFGRGGSTHPAVFLSEDETHALGVSGIQRIVKRLGRAAGVPWARPHLFRHTYATQSVIQGLPLPALQTFLGHENLRTTSIYMSNAALQDTARGVSRTPADWINDGPPRR